MQLIDYRVLYQYRNTTEERDSDDLDVVRTTFGPIFGFTTILATSPESAAEEITLIHSFDQDFAIVQVVVANDFETGFPE